MLPGHRSRSTPVTSAQPRTPSITSGYVSTSACATTALGASTGTAGAHEIVSVSAATANHHFHCRIAASFQPGPSVVEPTVPRPP